VWGCSNNGDSPRNIKDQSVDQGQNRHPTGPSSSWKQVALKPRYWKHEEGNERPEMDEIEVIIFLAFFIILCRIEKQLLRPSS
jgi:hypothetical protein